MLFIVLKHTNEEIKIKKNIIDILHFKNENMGNLIYMSLNDFNTAT